MKSFKEILIENEFLSEAQKSKFLSSNPIVKEIVSWMHAKVDKSDMVNKIKDLYSKLKPTLENIRKKLDKMITSLIGSKGISKSTVKVLTDVKSPNSMVSKVVERGKDIRNVGDLVRGAVLFEYLDDVLIFVKNLKRKMKSYVVDYESKDKGYDNDFGYFGSHHFDLNIDGLIVELQVMTKKLWNYKEVAHQIYNNYRDIIPKGGEVKEIDKQLSKTIFTKGNISKTRMQECFDKLEKDDLLVESLETIDYDILKECLIDLIIEKNS